MSVIGETDDRLIAVTLDEGSLGTGSGAQAQERLVAIADLLDTNVFALAGHRAGPYRLHLALHGSQLAFDIRTAAGEPVVTHLFSLNPFRTLVRDYLLVCENHVAALRTATPDQIEALDMGRRSLHNEGAERLRERLAGKITADFATMRRLFTLLTALHWRGVR